MDKLYVYTSDISRNDILMNPNITFMQNLGYKCLTIQECPNISEYVKKNNIVKCVCILHLSYVAKYLLLNEEFLKSNNYIFVFYGDIHYNKQKSNSYNTFIESLKLIEKYQNAYMYGGAFYRMKFHHSFFPQEKIINGIYNSVNDNFLIDDKINMSPKNEVLVSGASSGYYPARRHMLYLSQNNPEISSMAYDATIIGKKYLHKLREYLCCFTCSMCDFTGYLVCKFFEIPASGALLLAHDSNVKEHMKKLGFIDGENYISCTISNMLEKVKYICDPLNRKEIDRIRYNGYKLVINHHKLSHRMEYLDKIITNITYNYLYGLYKCDICNLTYNESSSLEIHKQGIHNEISEISKVKKQPYKLNYGRFECTFCGNIYRKLPSINSHINHMHKNDVFYEEYDRPIDKYCIPQECVKDKSSSEHNYNYSDVSKFALNYMNQKKLEKIIWIGSKKIHDNGVFINYFSKSFNSDNVNVCCDILVICGIIEKIDEPEDLIRYIKSFNAKYFIISTQSRKCSNIQDISNIREWTFTEFKMYLNRHFRIIDSFLGQNESYCQYHLCEEYEIE